MSDVRIIAQMCHEVNRLWCIQNGDMSQPSWSQAPAWQRSSAIDGVQNALKGEGGPEDSHNSWLAFKEAEGWKYGPVKDPEKKEHPCFVPYEELPPDQQAKDKLFTAVVHALKDFT